MKIGRIQAFVAIGVLAVAYQNCTMDGFGVLDQHSTSSGNIETTVSQRDVSELGLMASIFGPQPAGRAAMSGACQILGGQETLPLVTHYPQLGGKVAPRIWNINASADYAAGRTNVPQYDLEKFPLPQLGAFIADNFDIAQSSENNMDSQAKFENYLKQLCTGDLTSVRFIQGANEIKAPGDISALIVENAAYFQVLHSLVFKNNLFTIIVPPRWTRASSTTLPTLFNGFYDLNANFLSLDGPAILETLSQTYAEKQKAGFGILWNGRGAIGSRTVDNIAYAELNQFLQIYLNDLGAASDEFITFGSSRGGITSLNVASHPAVTAARVAFVYSSVPPYELNTVAQLVTPTIPALLPSSDWSVGFVGSWQNSFRHPSGTTRIGFQGLNGVEAHLKVITGASNPADVGREFNALTAAKTAKLIRNSTQILLEVGSHDFIVPSTDQFRLFTDAIASGVSLEARVNYLLGHAHDIDARRLKLASVFGALVDRAAPGQSFVTMGRVRRFVANPNGSLSALPSGSVPLTVELPRYIIDESDPMILATGPPNGRYMLSFRKGTELLKINLELDSKGLLNLRLPHSLFTAGDYELYGTYTVDIANRPVEKVMITSLATRGLIISRVPGDIRAFVANAGGTIMDGINAQGRYFSAGVANGTNYGFLQSGTAPISTAELAIISPPPSPTPASPQTPISSSAVFSCSVSNSSLAAFSMSGTIKSSGTDAGKLGYYFAAGYDVSRNEWWSFDGLSWAKNNGSLAGSSPISGPNPTVLSGTGISGPIFLNTDLRPFPVGEIYIGYGVGATTSAAWTDLINNIKYKRCVTLPRN